MLAGVRGIKPRPVGFQFHAVLVVNSAHLASLASSDNDRWLPLFWSIDNFKKSQLTNKNQNDGWMMPAVDEAKIPTATSARQRFIDAMDNWDDEGADRAVTALARSQAPMKCTSCSSATALAISATSATRPSMWPTPGAPCRRSAGVMPSRSCALSLSPCWSTRATIPPNARMSATSRSARI